MKCKKKTNKQNEANGKNNVEMSMNAIEIEIDTKFSFELFLSLNSN